MNDWDETTRGLSGPPSVVESRERFPVLVAISGPRLLLGRTWRVDRALTVGRAGEADVWLDEEGVSRQHLTLTPGDGGLEVRDNGSRNGVWINGRRVERAWLREGDTLQLGANLALRLLYRDAAEDAAARTLQESAMRDGLTQAYNRAYFLDQLRKEVASALRYRHPLTLALLDLDHFKTINDTHGHSAGDLVLRHFSRTVQMMIRAEDTFGRVGGEEFGLCLRQCRPEEGQQVLERIRRAVESMDVLHDGKRVTATVSVGVAGVDPDKLATDASLLEAADGAVYRAKREGRNRVVITT